MKNSYLIKIHFNFFQISFQEELNIPKHKYEVGYETLRITNTRFRIVFKDVYFDILQFFRLVGAPIIKRDIYMMTDSQQVDLIRNSFRYDNKKIKYEQIMGLFDYLQTYNFVPKLEKIQYILNPKSKFIRTTTKAIGIEKNSEFIKARHIGINSKKLNEKELQAFVDYFYQNYDLFPYYMGYIFYMFYERLHPNPEYNGIIGRLLFVENSHYDEHYPLSTFLYNVKCKYVDDIYELFSFSQESKTPSNSALSNSTSSQSQDSLFEEPENNNKYFSIKLNEEAISKIILILAFSVLYYQHQNDDNETKELLIKYFQDPFEDNPEFDNIKIENFKEIREMINELNWNKEDESQQE